MMKLESELISIMRTVKNGNTCLASVRNYNRVIILAAAYGWGIDMLWLSKRLKCLTS